MARHFLVFLLVGALCVLGSLPHCQAQEEAESDVPEIASGRFGFIRKFVSSAGSLLKKATNAAVRFALTKSTGDETCFGPLGCFSFKLPWVSADRPLPGPENPEDILPNFFMYSRAAPERFTLVGDSDMTLEGVPYDGSKPTFFIIHGYTSNGEAPWMSKLKDALLKRVDGNVVLVDWGNGSGGQYLQVASNTRVIAKIVAWFGHMLIKEGGAKATDFHFLGHSLGAHICGYAARNITNVGRITAFDPAGPTFDGQDSQVRLSTDAATFVEALHTNAKPITSLGFGAMRPLAHNDYYVNGGINQPGCTDINTGSAPTSISDLFSMSAKVVSGLISCSHGRAALYYAEALDNPDCVMWAHRVPLARQYLRWIVGEAQEVPDRAGKCRKGMCVPLGLETPLYPARGAFSVTTNSQEPFCIQSRSGDGQDLDTLKTLGLLKTA